MSKLIVAPLLILLFLVSATTLIILYGKGYRLTLKQDQPLIAKTGLLVANSIPNGAEVYIDGQLGTATDNTINLSPGTYDIKIQKDGYFPWSKKLAIYEEIVTKAEARLFPVAPKLESISILPVLNPIVDPTGTKIAYQIASESAGKNGIYILNMASINIPVPILTLQRSSIQIIDDSLKPFSESELRWSPDGTQILAGTGSDISGNEIFLLNADKFNDDPQNVTIIIQNIEDSFRQLRLKNNARLLNNLKKNTRQLVSSNFNIISWSPDETKILYHASESANLPLIIEPRKLGINTLSEERQISKENLYIYDTKEDTNMPLSIRLPATCQKTTDTETDIAPNSMQTFKNCQLAISWFPDSKNLLYINDKKIIVMDNDGSNHITVYAGPFVDSFAIAWPDSSKIVIHTNLGNPNASPTFYTIGLK